MTLQKVRPPQSAHEALVELVEACGGVKAVAAFEGCSESTVYKWLDPDQREEISIVRAARLTGHFGCAALPAFFARLADGVFIPSPKAEPGETLAEEAGEATKRFGHMMSDLGRLLESGEAGKRGDARLRADVDRVLVALYRFRETASEPGPELAT